MHEYICDPKHLWVIIGSLVFALLVVSIGRGGGALLLSLLKKLFGGGEKVNINLGGGMSKKQKDEHPACATCATYTDPTKCPLHEAEHERSLRNETGIKELVTDLRQTREKLFCKLDEIDHSLTEIKVAMAKLVVERNFQIDDRRGHK
jgi:hypothetical protein